MQRQNSVQNRMALRTGSVMLAMGILALAGSVCSFAPIVSARAAEAAKADPVNLTSLTTKLGDLEARVNVTKFDTDEMEKIGRNFGLFYRLKNMTLQYKQPDKIRMTSKVPLFGDALMIVNGSTRYYKIPRMSKNVEDLAKSPGKRSSLLEYGGVISPDTLRYMQGHFVRQEKLGDAEALVYDLTYAGAASGLHYRLWIDPETHITRKRDWLDADNKVKATFLYQDPEEVSPGVWLPKRIEIKNAEGITAVVSVLSDIKVNQGLSDDLFAIQP